MEVVAQASRRPGLRPGSRIVEDIGAVVYLTIKGFSGQGLTDGKDSDHHSHSHSRIYHKILPNIVNQQQIK